MCDAVCHFGDCGYDADSIRIVTSHMPRVMRLRGECEGRYVCRSVYAHADLSNGKALIYREERPALIVGAAGNYGSVSGST